MAIVHHRWGSAMRTAVLVAAGVLVSACGVSLQAEPEPIPPDVLPSPVVISPSPTPLPSVTGTTTPTPEPVEPDPDVPSLRLWFVQEDGLTAVESSLPVGSNPEFVMQALVVGPTPLEAAQGLRTIASDPLTGQPLALIVATPESAAPDSSGRVPITVELSQDFTALPPTEQVLLLGQLVLSLTGAGETSVAFVDQSGAPVAVPLPDGRLLDTPARARDFGPLIFRP